MIEIPDETIVTWAAEGDHWLGAKHKMQTDSPLIIFSPEITNMEFTGLCLQPTLEIYDQQIMFVDNYKSLAIFFLNIKWDRHDLRI